MQPEKSRHARKGSGAKKRLPGKGKTRIAQKIQKTQRRETEQFHSHLAAISEATIDFVGYADAKTKQILYINKAGRKMVGIGERDDVTRLKVSDVHPEWTNKMLANRVFPAARRKGVWRGECAFLHRDGREIPVLMALMAHKNEKGEMKTFSTISRDISDCKRVQDELKALTKTLEKRVRERTSALEKANKELQSENKLRKKTEKALNESEHLYRTLIENAPDAVFLVGNDQKIIACNKQVAIMHGFESADELIGKTVCDFVGPDEYQHVQRSWQEIVETGHLRNAEFIGKKKDGTRFPAEINVNLLRDQAGNPISQIVIVRDLTVRKKLEAEARKVEKKFQAIVETSKDWIWSIDTTGRITYNNPAVTAILGYREEDLRGKNSLDFMHEEDRKKVEALMPEWIAKKTGWSGLVLRWRHKNGAYRYLESNAVPVFDEQGTLTGFSGTDRDITEQMIARNEISKLSAAVKQSVNIIFITDIKGQIEYVNSTFEKITGYSREEAIGQTPRILKSGEASAILYEELWNTILSGKTWKGTLKNKRKNGQYYYCESIISPIRNEKGQITHFLCVQEDITEKVELQKDASLATYYATFDGLTGLYNRTRFMELLEEWIVQAKARNYTGAMLLIDIDRFRQINDTYGSKTGDDLLKRIADFLKDSIDEIDMQFFLKASERGVMESLLCRMGGDEFAILLPSRTKEEAMETADEIRKKLESFQFGGWTGHITVSVGIVMYPMHGVTLYDLLKKADASVFSAKELGRNRVRLYQPEDMVLEQMHARLEWKGRIQKAIRDNRIEAWYQPILDLKTGAITHYEALVRMRNEDLSIVHPGEFIDTAESLGLIMDIDRVVVERTLRFNKQLLEKGKHFHFSLNLSAKDLDDMGFKQFLKERVAEMKEDATRLIFEITETTAVYDLDKAVKFIRELKTTGCKFSLDDFGVGFTSFKYLQDMELDYIKIDGSFIRKLPESSNDRLFVKSMVDVAQGMGIKTVAEFVENEPTIKILRKLGVDYAQGYFIGKPDPGVL